MTQAFESQSLSDNIHIAGEILSVWREHRIFAFYGELGAGKTTFIQAFCQALGVTSSVTSPTFTIIHEYTGLSYDIYHFDFYRLSNEAEALALGCDEYFDSGAYCFIEWPERIPGILPETTVHIRLQVLTDQRRKIEVSYGEGPTIH